MSPSSPLDTLLHDLAKDHATGSLRVGRAGTVYFADGRVSYVESTSTPGVEAILTASGRISAAALRSVRQSAATSADGGDALLRQGLLTRGELQFGVLGSTLDAAFFVLTATGTRPRFKDGDRHWLGDHWYFDVAGLLGECRRRRAQLDQVWPSPELDSRPVALIPRISTHRVVLTAVQWEVLLNADATATPLDLARKLGRPAYAVLLAVRQLGAAGLLLAPQAPPEATGPARRTAAAPKAPHPPPPPPLPTRAGRSGPRPGTLLGAPAPQGAAGSLLPEVSGDSTDISVLLRLRDALERL